MIERRSVSRLRNAGTVGALAIIGVLVLQATILIVLSMTAQPPSRSVNASGLRRAYTIRILYDATVHNEADLHNTIAALSASQARFGDLTPDQSEIFSRFLTTPNQADGQALFTIFNDKTNAYESNARTRRSPFRVVAIITGLVAIVLVAILYYRLARPAEARFAKMVERLEESQERLSSMFDFHPDAVALIDANSRIVRANAELERLTLYRSDELIGAPIDTLAPAQDAIEHAGLASPLFSDSSKRFDAALRARNGSAVIVRVDTVPMRAGGALEGVYVIARDVSHEREIEFREGLQRERLRALSRIASVHASSVDRQISETLQYAVRALEMEGSAVSRVYDDEVKIIHSVGDTIQAGDSFPFAESYTRHIFGTNKMIAFWNHESNEWETDPAQARFGWGAMIITTAFADGVPVGALAFLSRKPRRRPFEEADLDFARVVATMIGAALARERREEELEEIAYVDSVTRLPNRRYAMDQLRLSIARAERSGDQIVAYFIDLDGFKAINDEFGHAIGDDFLAITAARLRAVLREGDILARVGGDEFVALQSGAASVDGEALRLGERLIQAASERAIFDGRSVAVGASVGIAAYPRDAATAEGLLERADQAMYASKRAGKGVATAAS
ncbi:MAG: diguanylate cyclase [Candidatus Aquilonibacter sp.]|jgi:diguanylate cyclase (GGDEF)-like protein/PAS domain S-box-containing protein